MSGCSLLERITVIENTSMDFNPIPNSQPRVVLNQLAPSAPSITPGGPGPGGGGEGPPPAVTSQPPPPLPPVVAAEAHLEGSLVGGGNAASSNNTSTLDRDYYGCFCLKFIVKNGSHITEEKVQEDFGQFGDVVDVRGPGLFSGLRGNHVYVRFIDQSDAEEALQQLGLKYHQLTPASISDVLPDNYGLYTISFYNKTGIPSAEVRKEFSKFGEVKNLTGSLDVKGGRVFVSYKEKSSAVQALQAFFFRKDKYPNMKFALPRCEKDYFGCYCLKFYNKSGDVTEDKVTKDFGQFGEVVDVRGPGLFDVTGDDVYVRYKEKSSAEQALIELVGKYDSLCLAPPSDIQADKFGYFTITFVNDKCLSKSDVWYIFSKFGTVACVNGTFDCKKGRVFVSYKEKQGALNALETMLITKEYHLQVSKNSTVRKNDYNVVGGNVKESSDAAASDFAEFSVRMSEGSGSGNGNNSISSNNGKTNSSLPVNPILGLSSSNAMDEQRLVSQQQHQQHHHHQSRPREPSQGRDASVAILSNPSPSSSHLSNPPGAASSVHHHQQQQHLQQQQQQQSVEKSRPLPPHLQQHLQQQQQQQHPGHNGKNGLVKFNRNVEKDIFGYFCLSFLNEDGDISEKKVRHDFGKFGEVVSVRGALGKQKGHVFVRFRRKEAAENCLNCLNSFPLSEMSELFGKYLFLSPATPRDIDCDMYGLYSISFLNLNMKSGREIRAEFLKFGELVRLTSGGGGNTDELVSISYAEKHAAVKALQTHFTNKEFPYLDIAKGSSLLLVNSSDSSDNEDNESDYTSHPHHREMQRQQHGHMQHSHMQQQQHNVDPFHDPSPQVNGQSSDVVDELLKPFQSYFSIYRTGQYQSLHGDQHHAAQGPGGLEQQHFNNGHQMQQQAQRSPDKKYRIKSVKNGMSNQQQLHHHHHHHHPPPPHQLQSNGGHPPPPRHRFSAPPPTPPQGMLHNGVMDGCSRPLQSQPPPPSSRQQQIPHAGRQQQRRQGHMQHKMPLPSGLQSSVAGTSASAKSSQSSSMQSSPERESAATTTTMTTIATTTTLPPLRPSSPPQAMVADAAPTASATKEISPDDGGDELAAAQTAGLVNGFDHQFPSAAPSHSKEPSSIPSDNDATSPPSSSTNVEATAVSVSQEIPAPQTDERVEAGETPVSSANANADVPEDLLGHFSVSFSNRAKDLTERKVRLDFGSSDVLLVRGLCGLSKHEIGTGELVVVSFASRPAAEQALRNDSLRTKYAQLACAPRIQVRPDKDGYFTVDFVNSGMSGIREITNEFSRHGEVKKVIHSGGAKNAVKRVSVSYDDRQAAFDAVKDNANSKDFAALYFARDCILEPDQSDSSSSKEASPPLQGAT